MATGACQAGKTAELSADMLGRGVEHLLFSYHDKVNSLLTYVHRRMTNVVFWPDFTVHTSERVKPCSCLERQVTTPESTHVSK
jgi:glucan phosphorylase